MNKAITEAIIKAAGFRAGGGFARFEVNGKNYTPEQIVAALSAGQAQPVAIKPLEWQTYAGGGTDFAETILGSWSVWDFDGENAHVRGPSDHAGRLVGGNLDTAKAAAQSDYEARIRSALVSRAVPGEVETKSREGCVGEMTPDRAIYFLDRFKREEKMLGPHEQWALDFAISALSAPLPEIEGGDKGDGWQLVPIEPTPEMLGAWYRYKNGHHWPDEPPPRDTSDYGAYRAMLAASPSASIEGETKP